MTEQEEAKHLMDEYQGRAHFGGVTHPLYNLWLALLSRAICVCLLDDHCLGQSWFPQKVLYRMCLLSYLPPQVHPTQDIWGVVTSPLPTSLSCFKT